MRITKVEVNGKKVAIQRNMKSGRLIFNEDITDRTEEILRLKQDSFYKSVINKTICKGKDAQQIKVLFEGLLYEDKQSRVNLTAVKTMDKNKLKELFTRRFRQEFSYVSSKESLEQETFDLVNLFIKALSEQNQYVDWTTFSDKMQPYTTWVSHYIEFRKTLLEKSIRQNKIYSSTSLKSQVLSQYVDAFARSDMDFNLEEVAKRYKLTDLVKKLHKTFDDNNQIKAAGIFHIKIKEALQQHERTLFNKEQQNFKQNREDKELVLFTAEVRQYIAKNFPIKKDKAKKGKRIVLSEAKILHRIKQKYQNAMTQYLLNEGKRAAYKLGDNTTSEDLTNIKIGEAFALKFLNACFFGANSLRNILEVDGDVLSSSSFRSAVDNMSQNKEAEIRHNLELFFSGISELCKNSEELGEVLWGLRGAIQRIRNNLVHFNEHSWNQILTLGDEKIEKIDKLYVETKFQDLFTQELKNIPILLKEKMLTAKIFDYYPASKLENSFDKYSLLTSVAPFAPSFKRVHTKGCDYQYSRKRDYNLQLKVYKEKDKFSEKEAENAYYNLLKIIYYQMFLPTFTKDYRLFKESTEFVLKINKQRDNQPSAFEFIRPMEEHETPSDYMGYIQSSLMQQQKKVDEQGKDNFFNRYITQIFIKGFDSYIIKNDLEFSLAPVKQEFDSEKIDLLNFKEEIDAKYIPFWVFCKVLNTKMLSELRNEMIKFSRTELSKEKREAFIEAQKIIGLALMTVDRGSSEWIKVFSRKENWQKTMEMYVSQDLLNELPYVQEDHETPILFRSVELVKKHGAEKLLSKIVGDNLVTAEDVQFYQADHDIENVIASKEAMHKKWERDRRKASENDFKKSYGAKITKISDYRWNKNKVELNYIRSLHNLAVDLISRLTGFMAIADRDFQFLCNALLARREAGFRVKSWVDLSRRVKFKSYEVDYINGEVELSNQLEETSYLIGKLEEIQAFCINGQYNGAKSVRNEIDHWDKLRGGGSQSILELYNSVRELVSYDRKLKNAVTKSLIDLLEGHGIVLTLKNKSLTEASRHDFEIKSCKPKEIRHLGNRGVTEKQVSDEYCQLVERLLKLK
ncbi:type VI-A CRISPR-associated RNA-guided ribonuclease Cas13a [Listeria costaricensis]|uniref:type VI-A CRISPR-associated RNA-guided ribonuclease Cas13a n=1 Tax=Listeria costaricensis TaxID=2026604 RepID=UPI000C077C83|nr:type VI-A CRISPR-associated RNA-guided ribonuclease Cas13a [Listeria costaricensis]